MPNRTAKFVSAIFASILAGTPLATISHGETVAADDCLSAPKGQTPAGGHWYYRIEHGTKRHCWYLARGSATSFRKLRPRTPRHRQIRFRRKQTRQCNSRWPTPAPSCPRRPTATRCRTPLCPRMQRDRTIPTRTTAPDATRTSSVVASRWPEPSARQLSIRSTTGDEQFGGQRAGKFNSGAGLQPLPRSLSPPRILHRKASPARSRRCWSRLLAPWRSPASRQVSSSNLAARDTRDGAAIRARRGPIWESTDDDRIALSDYPEARRSPAPAPIFPRYR